MNGAGRRKGGSKTESVGQALLAMARQRGPGIKLPTLGELGTQLSVSRTTIERALQPLERRGLFVRRQGSGIYATAAIRLKTVGVAFGGDIFGEGYSPFWRLLLSAFREQTDQREMLSRAYLDVLSARGGLGGHAQLVEDLEALRLDGLLFLAPPLGWSEEAFVRNLGVPVITLDTRSKGWVAGFDMNELLRLAARQVDAPSAKRVALLGVEPNQELLENELRRAGYVGEPVRDWSYVRWSRIVPLAGTHENCARKLVWKGLSSEGREALPDVIVSTEDTMTRGAVTALRDAGLQIGRDIQIVTSENRGSSVLEPFAESLRRIVFDPADVIRAALGMLETLMDGGTPPERKVLVAPHAADAAANSAWRGIHELVKPNPVRQAGDTP